ncbi:MAG TPA: cyclic nucleotide-binding domain-containing protein, partial [Candidatus Marinimicrobia bacterium]|nr:cyclic nucleotide-binding domain-containing protein [Candidatus Neomarinimicrobiota bacterium]
LLIIENIHSNDELTPFTISCAGDRCIYKQVEILPQYLESTSNAIRSSSAVAILKQEPEDKEARAALDLILDEGSENNIVETLGFMKGLIGFMSQNQFLRFLSHKSDNIKNASLSLIEKNPDNSYLNSVIQSLAKASTFSQAEKALLSFPEKTSLVQLDFRLNDPTSSTELRAGILKILHHYHRTDTINIIISIMDDPELLILDEASNALVNLSKNTTLVKSELETIDAKIYTVAKRAYQLYQFRRHIKDDPDALLLLDHIENDLGMLIPILLKLGTLKDPDIPIETYIRYVESNDPELLPIVLELIESTFSAENRTVSLPLIDPESDPIKAGQELFPDIFNSAEQMLMFWTENHHYWKTGIAIHYLLKKENTAVLKKINWSEVPSAIFTGQLYRQSEQDYLNRNFLKESFSNQENKTMYSILEKTIILKSVNLFNAIPGDVLTKIAQIAEEIRTSDKYKIFREGDHGDSMFVIISGKVNVAQNGQSIAVLEQGKCIGEMALLDQEPRSADAITLEESVLLKIDQEGFYELMASNPEIMKQIVKILTRRIREMNKKLTDART